MPSTRTRREVSAARAALASPKPEREEVVEKVAEQIHKELTKGARDAK